MGEMGQMQMPVPTNSVPMRGDGPFAHIDMGGMFTVLKVRNDPDHADPAGWYQHYVEILDEYCPARVFSLQEAGTDAADFYDRGVSLAAARERLSGKVAVLASPTQRTRQTAHALGLPFEVEPKIGPGANAQDLLEASGWSPSTVSRDGTVILVGHQPAVGVVYCPGKLGRGDSGFHPWKMENQ